MTARRRSRWLPPLVLLAVCGALGTVLYDQVRHGQTAGVVSASSTTGGPAIEPLPTEAVFSMPPQDTYSGIVERPLFSPNRRPETGASFTPADPGADVSIKLVGTFIMPAERFALFKLGDNEQTARVDEGGEIAGWTVKEIHEFSALLERDGETLEIFLQYDDTPPPPPEPVEPAEPEQPVEEVPPSDAPTETGAGTITQ